MSAPAPIPRPDRSDSEEQDTGLPGLHSWWAVYGWVLGIFLLWVVLLTWLARHFS